MVKHFIRNHGIGHKGIGLHPELFLQGRQGIVPRIVFPVQVALIIIKCRRIRGKGIGLQGKVRPGQEVVLTGILGGQIDPETIVVGAMGDSTMKGGPSIVGIPREHRGFTLMGTTDQKLCLCTAPGYRKLGIVPIGRPTDQFLLPIRIPIVVPKRNIGPKAIKGRIFESVPITIINNAFTPQFQVLWGIQQIHKMGDPTQGGTELCVESGLPYPTFFGGDQHHSISPSRSIYGRGIRIFEHFNAFNIIGVDGIERTDVPRKNLS